MASVYSSIKAALLKRGAAFVSAIESNNGIGDVCVVRSTGGIGDILMMTPALRELKLKYPEVTLTVALNSKKYSSLLNNAPFVDHIIESKFVTHSNYIAVADLSSCCSPGESKEFNPVNRIDMFGYALGLDYINNKLPFWEVTPCEEDDIEISLWAIREFRFRLVCIHSQSADKNRSWPIEEAAKLAKLIEANCPDVTIVVFDRYHHWRTHSNVIDMSSSSIREMAAWIAEADLFIGPDSGPMHIAAALKIPSLILFGAVPPEARINYYKTHYALQNKTVDCLGCWSVDCKIGAKCMKDIAAEDVYEKVKRLGLL